MSYIRETVPSTYKPKGSNGQPGKRAWTTVRGTRGLTHGRRVKGRTVSEIETYTHEVAVDSMAVSKTWQLAHGRKQRWILLAKV